MSIEYQVLGAIGHDNALFVRLNTGKAIYRLLFDCGEGCLSQLANADIQSVDHLLFSHLHMDHIGGFDTFFRSTFNRKDKPNVVWGPPDTGQIMHCRFQGFMWNLHNHQPGTWHVHDIYHDHIAGWRFVAAEAFEYAHATGTVPFTGTIIDEPAFTVA